MAHLIHLSDNLQGREIEIKVQDGSARHIPQRPRHQKVSNLKQEALLLVLG